MLLVVGLWINRLLETFKTQQAKLLETFKGQQALSLETFKSERSLENELSQLRDAKHIEFVDKQLSQFYWPIYMRLEIDSAVWERILDKENEDELRRKIGKEIEKNFILPNHEEIVQIMQSNIHLAVPDAKTFQAMLQYIRHVAVYKAMRAAECYDKDPIHLGEPWPNNLFTLIKRAVENLQAQYNELIQPPKSQPQFAPGTASSVEVDHLSTLQDLANKYREVRVRGFSKSTNQLNEAAHLLGDYVLDHKIPKDTLVLEIAKGANDGLIVALATAIRLSPEEG